MEHLTEAELGYFAGIIDGEGSINVVRTGSATGIRGYRYSVRITVVNTDRRLIDWLYAALRERGSVSKRPGPKTNHKDSYVLNLRDQVASPVLQALLPHLRLKREQAELALELNARCLLRRGRTRRLSDEEWAGRDRIYKRMRELNYRGRDYTSKHEDAP